MIEVGQLFYSRESIYGHQRGLSGKVVALPRFTTFGHSEQSSLGLEAEGWTNLHGVTSEPTQGKLGGLLHDVAWSEHEKTMKGNNNNNNNNKHGTHQDWSSRLFWCAAHLENKLNMKHLPGFADSINCNHFPRTSVPLTAQTSCRLVGETMRWMLQEARLTQLSRESQLTFAAHARGLNEHDFAAHCCPGETWDRQPIKRSFKCSY